MHLIDNFRMEFENFRIGEVKIESIDVIPSSVVIRDKEIGGWISAVGVINIRADVVYEMIYQDFGCWRDTDNDHAEWNSDMEGARLIAALCTGKNAEDRDPGWVRMMFPAICEEIGAWICDLLRDVAKDIQ